MQKINGKKAENRHRESNILLYDLQLEHLLQQGLDISFVFELVKYFIAF